MAESLEFKGPVNKSGERTVVRDMCFLGAPWGANACMVDVKDDKVIRIRPPATTSSTPRDEVKPWVMHARGKTFEPGDKTSAAAAQPRLQEAGLFPGAHPLSP